MKVLEIIPRSANLVAGREVDSARCDKASLDREVDSARYDKASFGTQ